MIIESHNYININPPSTKKSKKILFHSLTSNENNDKPFTFNTQRNFPIAKFLFGKLQDRKEETLVSNNKSKVELNDLSLHNEKYFKDIIKEKDKEIELLKNELLILQRKYTISKQQQNFIANKQSSFDIDTNSNVKNYNAMFKGFNTRTSNETITARIDYKFPSNTPKMSVNGIKFNNSHKISKLSYDDTITMSKPKNDNYKSLFESIKKRMKNVLDKYSQGILSKTK